MKMDEVTAVFAAGPLGLEEDVLCRFGELSVQAERVEARRAVVAEASRKEAAAAAWAEEQHARAAAQREAAAEAAGLRKLLRRAELQAQRAAEEIWEVRATADVALER